MYTIVLKNTRNELAILTTRILLAIAGITAWIYAGYFYSQYLSFFCAIILLSSSFFVKKILESYRVNRLLLMSIAALLTYLSSGLLLFSSGLLLMGFFFQLLNKSIVVILANESVTIRYVFRSRIIPWATIANLVLKDRLITLDFKDDHILQQEIDEASYNIDEKEFNAYCASKLKGS
jgi:hypothetical protein